MIGTWTINVSGRVYGPFTSERMRSFVGEGRLAPHSLIARDGSTDWHEARDEPEFSEVFAHRGARAPAMANTANGAPTTAAAPQPAPSRAAQPSASPALHANASESVEHQIAHFAIVADLKAQSVGNLEGAINSLGPSYRLTHNVWIVSTEQTVSGVRNRLIQELGKSDSLFVIDASRGKAAWFNFGPEADARIRRVWQRQ